jgi:hypothetical protein
MAAMRCASSYAVRDGTSDETPFQKNVYARGPRGAQGARGERHSFSPLAPVCYRPSAMQLLLTEFSLRSTVARSRHAQQFSVSSLCPLRPHSAISGSNLCRSSLLVSAAGAHEGDGAMEITVHKHLIEQCVMMACASKADRDKALWLTMAQSWGRLADEVERSRTVPDHKALFQTDRRYHRA